MKKYVIILIALSLMLSGCSVIPLSPEKAAEKTAALMAEGDAAAAGGELEAALEKYSQAEALTPADMDALRGQIGALGRLAEQNEEYRSQLIGAYEKLYAADAFTEDEYMALARLYIEEGYACKARDLLEISQCFAPSADKAALLDTITAAVSQESEKTRRVFAALEEKLGEADKDAAVDYILGGALSELRSRVPTGSRRYSSDDNGALLKLIITRDKVGESAVKLWYTAAGGEITFISCDGAALVVASASLKDGVYDGAFSAEYYKAANGSVVADSGSFSNGAACGGITTETCAGGEATGLAALWSQRNALERTSFSGELDEDGHPTAAAASGLESGQIVYGYTEDKNQYVYVIGSQEDTAESFVFTPSVFGFEDVPSW